ncbi:MAG: NAD(P)/FAD-dependent oxidoreductase [Pseudobacter sp.]|uniref:NAD(P)/FAD-dependent oxidoreductase n=1 Tax=Pseudobacter sp. TaxID=2045420 RepID=UPI003F7DE523
MITAEKELHFGNPLWSSHPSRNLPVDVIRKDLRTDVVIIGAGISGSMIAEELTDAGLKVVILDKRYPGHGSTMATTALLQFEIDQPLVRLIPLLGYEKAARAWRRAKLCTESLAVRIQMLGISCGLHLQQSLYLNGNKLSVDELRKEMELRNQIGLQSEFIKRKKLFDEYGLHAAAALRSYHSYSAHPYRLSNGFLLKALERGAAVYSPVAVSDISSSPRRVYIQTSYGFNITARYAVFATGYEVPEYLSDQPFKIYSTWAMATPKQADSSLKRLPLIWEAADPYLYIRPTPDGRIICGGEDEEFSNEERRNALNTSKLPAIQRKLSKLLPQIDTSAEFAWSGAFGVTSSGLPLIGDVPGLDNCFAVMAFGGNGITWSRMGAEMIRNLITGKEEIDEDLVRFHRK